jgi:transposase
MQQRVNGIVSSACGRALSSSRRSVSHLAELGIIAPQGREGVKELLAIISNEDNKHLPNDARASLIVLAAQLQALQTTIGAIEKRIVVQHRASKESKRLQTVPGIGIIGASAIAATVTNPKIFRSGRDFAAWIGLVPRQMSTGGKPKLGPISKQGDRYLRRILVVGAVSVLRRAKNNPETDGAGSMQDARARSFLMERQLYRFS